MAIVKASGMPPNYATDLRREIRGDLRPHDRAALAGALKADRAQQAAEGMAALSTMAESRVAHLDADQYRRAKRDALKACRKVE
jgi:hypothetical protein